MSTPRPRWVEADPTAGTDASSSQARCGLRARRPTSSAIARVIQASCSWKLTKLGPTRPHLRAAVEFGCGVIRRGPRSSRGTAARPRERLRRRLATLAGPCPTMCSAAVHEGSSSFERLWLCRGGGFHPRLGVPSSAAGAPPGRARPRSGALSGGDGLAVPRAVWSCRSCDRRRTEGGTAARSRPGVQCPGRRSCTAARGVPGWPAKGCAAASCARLSRGDVGPMRFRQQLRERLADEHHDPRRRGSVVHGFGHGIGSSSRSPEPSGSSSAPAGPTRLRPSPSTCRGRDLGPRRRPVPPLTSLSLGDARGAGPRGRSPCSLPRNGQRVSRLPAV